MSEQEKSQVEEREEKEERIEDLEPSEEQAEDVRGGFDPDAFGRRDR